MHRSSSLVHARDVVRKDAVRYTFLACGCLLLAACVTEDLGPMPAFQAPQWPDGETSVYVVTRNDSALYRSVLTLEFDEETGNAGASDTARTVPTLIATNVVRPVSPAEWFFDSVQAVIRRDNFAPLRTYRSVETDVSEYELTARYLPGRVEIERQTVDGTTNEQLRLPRRYSSYDAVQTWLRCVPLVSGTSFRDNLVVPAEFRAVPVKFLVLGTKLVTTGVGDIMCREIVLILPTREVKFWYELAQPHRFIGFNDAQNNTQMVLESYQPGRTDPVPKMGTARQRIR